MKKKYYWIIGIVIIGLIILFSALFYTWNSACFGCRGPGDFFRIELESITKEVNPGEYYKYRVTIDGSHISKSVSIFINYSIYYEDDLWQLIAKNNESIILNKSLEFDKEIFIPSNAEPGIYHISLMAVSENEITGAGDSFYVFKPNLREIARSFDGVVVVSPFSLSTKSTGQLNLTLDNKLNDTINIIEIQCKIQGDYNSYLYILTGNNSIAPSNRKVISVSNPYSATPTNLACSGINNSCYNIKCSDNNCYNTSGKSVGDYYYADLEIEYFYKGEHFVSIGNIIGTYS